MTSEDRFESENEVMSLGSTNLERCALSLEEQAENLAKNTLTGEAAAAFEEHLILCSACQARYEETLLIMNTISDYKSARRN